MLKAAEDMPPRGLPSPLRQVIARDGWAVVLAVTATITVQLGTYLLCHWSGLEPRNAVMATLAVGALWVALAPPSFAAGSCGGMSALLRGGIVADASAVILIVLWLATPAVTFLAAVKIYCTYAAMAIFGIAAVGLARKPVARCAAAIIAAILLIGALATPFWVGGILKVAGEEAGRSAATIAVFINPFYSITSAVSQQMGFVWHQSPLMYGITRLGDYAAPPPVPWYASAVIYGLLAGILGALKIARPPRRR